jgi:GNAT superfamily N-acetyltransferase
MRAHPDFSERPVTLADSDFLFQVYASTRKQEVAAFGWPPGEIESFLRMQFDMRRRSYEMVFPDAIHSILLADGIDAGAGIVCRSDTQIRLVDGAFLPEFRNRGLGTRRLQRYISQAKAAGLPLRLSVMQGNPARRLYERLGFIAKSGDGLYTEMEYRGA